MKLSHLLLVKNCCINNVLQNTRIIRNRFLTFLMWKMPWKNPQNFIVHTPKLKEQKQCKIKWILLKDKLPILKL